MSESGVVREINSRGLLVRLLTYAVRCPKVARVASTQLQPTHFDESTQLDFFMVWFVAQQIWLKGGAAPHPQHLKDLTVNLMNGEGYTDPALHTAAVNLVEEIYAFHEDPWNVEYGLELLNAKFEDVFRRDVMQVAQRAEGRNDALQDIIQKHQQLSVNQNKPFDPFDMKTKPTLSKRDSTGSIYFDLITGGGTIPSEVYGILGPSGGGKTLMALDISCHMAERGKRVEYFSYEQPPEELRQRMFSRIASIHIDSLKNREWDDLSEDTKKKITAASMPLKGNLMMHDRSSTGDSVADIINVIRESISEGRRPDLVVIDWLWPLILRISSSDTRGKQTQERVVMQRVTDQIKGIAAEYKTCILVLNQLSIEMSKKKSSKKPQWFNSAEAGSFAWLMHYCIAIGTQDEQGFCWLVGSKARNNAKTSFVVQCLGAMNRFELPKNSMLFDAQRGEFVDSENLNRMPGRERASASDDDSADELKGGLV